MPLHESDDGAKCTQFRVATRVVEYIVSYLFLDNVFDSIITFQTVLLLYKTCSLLKPINSIAIEAVDTRQKEAVALNQLLFFSLF